MNKKILYAIIILLSFSLLGSIIINYNLHKQTDKMIIDATNTTNSDTKAKPSPSAVKENGVSNESKIDEAKSNDTQQNEIYVDVGGAVKNPGVYRFKQGERVIDAINKAGGLEEDADTSTINMAKKLTDEEKVYIPKKGETPPQVVSGTSSGNSGVLPTNAKININTASLQELDSLPGIGPVTAQRIIDYRNQNGPFKSIEEIKNVSRIGDKIFEQIKDKITI
ncbi:competence protein ComEA [Caldanaerobius fijiensis DSM 17918]|uniref:Competence protein ComEA n=1 Tax=Caldanaerobius fijiensis DSM 17918 TaxID=1121256 RepID=A0A1M4TB97_9THEO|nr:helix-hairpin-helix domain-containing protein [Caldanaerobius fijiensis]SHE41711.1 competence protein ComEA [Caldanaerobius fijiensis DSM 17918]